MQPRRAEPLQPNLPVKSPLLLFLLPRQPRYGPHGGVVSIQEKAAVLCLYAKRQGNAGICRQILMYPFLDTATDPDAKGPGSLAGPIRYLFNDWFCPDESKRADPLVSPVFASREDLTGLPPAIFCLADVDSLKAEGYRYTELLKDAGVSVSATMMPDMPHGFFEYGFGEVNPESMGFLDQPTQQLILSGAVAGAAQQALAFVKAHLEEV